MDLALNDEADKTFRYSITFEDDGCLVVLSGGLDWTKDSDIIDKCFNEVWENKEITYLKIDCRNLFFISNEEVLGTYFLAVIIDLKNKARKRHIKLLIHLKSRRQVAVLSLWGKKMWRKFRRHFYFDDPD